jgi:K+/H+ antiporter YhaU regulatory subunit KhtT
LTDIRAKPGCTVVAVKRQGDAITSLDPDTFAFQEGDRLVIVGADEGVHRFEGRYPS